MTNQKARQKETLNYFFHDRENVIVDTRETNKIIEKQN